MRKGNEEAGSGIGGAGFISLAVDKKYSNVENVTNEASSDVTGECADGSVLMVQAEKNKPSNPNNETSELVSRSAPECHQEGSRDTLTSHPGHLNRLQRDLIVSKGPPRKAASFPHDFSKH